MAGRTLAGPRFPGDDGSAGPRVTAALTAYAAGRGSEHMVLAALDSARLIVPVVALATAEEAAAPGGPRREKSSEMAIPTVIGNDGRAALPAFTSAASLVPGPRAGSAGPVSAVPEFFTLPVPIPVATEMSRITFGAEELIARYDGQSWLRPLREA